MTVRDGGRVGSLGRREGKRRGGRGGTPLGEEGRIASHHLLKIGESPGGGEPYGFACRAGERADVLEGRGVPTRGADPPRGGEGGSGGGRGGALGAKAFALLELTLQPGVGGVVSGGEQGEGEEGREREGEEGERERRDVNRRVRECVRRGRGCGERQTQGVRLWGAGAKRMRSDGREGGIGGREYVGGKSSVRITSRAEVVWSTGGQDWRQAPPPGLSNRRPRAGRILQAAAPRSVTMLHLRGRSLFLLLPLSPPHPDLPLRTTYEQ